MPKKNGFTLIELLVVMTIIAILAIIGFALYESAQSAARDSKRRADMDAIATALEQHYNPYSHKFPAVNPGWFQSGTPTDPVYSGIPSGEVDTYTICAHLENANGNASGPDGINASGKDATYYCRKNLQGG